MSELVTGTDEKRLRDLIDALGDEEPKRLVRLTLLLESVRHAHRANPAGWSLTVSHGRQFLNLNAGRAFVHRLFPTQTWLTLEAGSLDSEIRDDLESRSVEQPEEFLSLPGLIYCKLQSEDLLSLWPSLRDAHFGAVKQAAAAVARTPYFTAHMPTLATILEDLLDEHIPLPKYGEGTVTPTRVAQLLELVRRDYPDWDSFAHSRFVADEINYKQVTVVKAREF